MLRSSPAPSTLAGSEGKNPRYGLRWNSQEFSAIRFCLGFGWKTSSVQAFGRGGFFLSMCVISREMGEKFSLWNSENKLGFRRSKIWICRSEHRMKKAGRKEDASADQPACVEILFRSESTEPVLDAVDALGMFLCCIWEIPSVNKMLFFFFFF